MTYFKSDAHFRNYINKIVRDNKEIFDKNCILIENIDEYLDFIYSNGYISQYCCEFKKDVLMASKQNVLVFLENINSSKGNYTSSVEFYNNIFSNIEQNEEYLNFTENLKCPGLYFFFTNDEEYLYIGKSKCLKDRIPNSYKERFLDYNNDVFLKVMLTKNNNDAGILEQYFICKFSPLFNKADKFGEKTTLEIFNIPEFSKSIKIIKKYEPQF
jgi:hypothetical protein